MSEITELTYKINADHLVNSVFRIKSEDKGSSAKLRRANNPSTQHYAWPIMVRLGFSLKSEKNNAIIPLIASSIVDEDSNVNGTTSFAQIMGGLAKDSPSLEIRFNRMLNATNTVELCGLLSANIKLVQYKVSDQRIDYIALTKDLINYDFKRDAIRAKWAEAFYRMQQSYENQKD